MSCERCEALPESLPEQGTLFLSPAVPVTSDRIVSILKARGLDYRIEDGLIQSPLSSEELKQSFACLNAEISEAEMEATRAMYLSEGSSPSFRDLLHMENLLTIYSRIEGAWLLDMLRDKRLLTHLQSIRRADDPGSIYGREALLRGVERDGSLVAAGKIFSVARKADLLFYLDREARLSAVKRGGAERLEGKLFINFNPTSIYTPDYCLKTTIAAINEARLETSEIVFEIVESDHIQDIPRMLGIVEFYRNNGFMVALDDLGAGFSSLNLLHHLKPDIVKLDMELIQGVASDRYRQPITRSLIEACRELGIMTVAEGIETREDYLWVRDAGADLVQGYYFDRPQ